MMTYCTMYSCIPTMQNVLHRLVVVFFIALGVCVPTLSGAVSPNCYEEVNALLGTPNQATHIAVSGAGEQECWAVIKLSNANLNRLIRSVEQGNRWAAKYLAEHLKKLDGGNLEDSLIALGKFSEHDMGRLLHFVKEGLLSDLELQDALTMLPLSLSDNPNLQLNVLRARRHLIMGVTQTSLGKQRAIALKAIDEFASEIKAHSQPTPRRLPIKLGN